MKGLLIIPAYNEEENIGALLDELDSGYSAYDYIVVNDTVSEAANTLDEIIRVQKCSTGHMKEFIDEVLEDE